MLWTTDWQVGSCFEYTSRQTIFLVHIYQFCIQNSTPSPHRKLPIRGFDSQMHKVRIIRTKPLKSNICLSQLKENIRERPRYFAVNKIGVRLRFCARRPHKPPHCSCTLSSYKKNLVKKIVFVPEMIQIHSKSLPRAWSGITLFEFQNARLSG